MAFRKVCGWNHAEFPIDNRGPIRPGDEVSHGLCATCAPLLELGHHVGRGNAWLRRLLYRIAQLEGDGRGHFGGTAVLAWWLCERTKPVPPMTGAKHAQIRRIAGSAPAYQRLMRIAHVPAPKRLRGGWTAGDVTTYVAGLVAERKAAAARDREILELQRWWAKRRWLWPQPLERLQVTGRTYHCEAFTAPEILEDEHATR